MIVPSKITKDVSFTRCILYLGGHHQGSVLEAVEVGHDEQQVAGLFDRQESEFVVFIWKQI